MSVSFGPFYLRPVLVTLAWRSQNDLEPVHDRPLPALSVGRLDFEVFPEARPTYRRSVLLNENEAL
jgi:hypothetical protein